MDDLEKQIKKAVALRFPANDDAPLHSIQNAYSKVKIWAFVALLSLALGFGLNTKPSLNATEVSVPTLPLAYQENNSVLYTDFMRPLPKLNLTFYDNKYSCLPALEIPPTLAVNWESCLATLDGAQEYNEHTRSELVNNFALEIINAKKDRSVIYIRQQL